MTESASSEAHVGIAYLPPPAGRAPAREFAAVGGPDADRRFTFFDYLEIGRLEPGQAPVPGVLRIADETVSERHCVITQDRRGRCWVRDTSRNGTRVDHRRLVPGAESELHPGQVLMVGAGHGFRLEEAAAAAVAPEAGERRTKLASAWTEATVVVGDIRGYTTLVRNAPQELLEVSVSALFHRLTREVTGLGGTVKEYSGDAILAYWEEGGGEHHAVRACRAALALDRAAARLATDRSVWRLDEWPARMEWALASGRVLVNSMGGPHPVGLSMVGPPVVLAYRLEKIADDDTGRIVTCAETRALAGDAFRFRALGKRTLEGFAVPQDVYALTEES